MSDIGLIVEFILKLLAILKPSELEKIKAEIEKLEKQHDKDKQEALAALQSGNVAALNLIICRLLEL